MIDKEGFTHTNNTGKEYKKRNKFLKKGTRFPTKPNHSKATLGHTYKSIQYIITGEKIRAKVVVERITALYKQPIEPRDNNSTTTEK